jgi:hypothetical protein
MPATIWREGDYVIFGRPKGEKTIAKVIKVNPKRIKVQTLTPRGKNKRVGEFWTIPKSDDFTKRIPSDDPRVKAARKAALGPYDPNVQVSGFGDPLPGQAPAWKTPTNRSNFYQRYYGSMVGGRITGTGTTKDGFHFFEVEMPDGKKLKCEISRDEEGNGPGFLFGLENPYDVERNNKKVGS